MGGGSRETRRREGEKTRQTRGENKENKCHTAIKESNTELKKKKEKKEKADAGDKDSLIYCYLPTSELEKELVMPVESVQYLIASIAAVNQMQ